MVSSRSWQTSGVCVAFICIRVVFDPGGPVNTCDIALLILVWIMEESDDLYDELIIDRVIGLAEGAQGFATHHSKRAIILYCVASKGQTADQIFTMENTYTIILDLMGLTSQKKGFAKRSGLELTTVCGHLGGVGQHCC